MPNKSTWRYPKGCDKMDMTPNAESRPGNPEEVKPPNPFKSIAQLKRCDGLVADGTVKKESFERDLLATDLDNTPWRKGPPKEEDGDAEYQAGYIQAMKDRKAALVGAAIKA